MTGAKRMYDALVVVSFGGPEGPDDVLPFMENVTRGRGIARERLVEVSAHYQLFGGVSPINGQNRALVEALRAVLDIPVYWGNRNWTPYLADTVRQMRDDGIVSALGFVTSAYSSYSGCRQYREDIERACAGVDGAPAITKLRAFFNHPGFVEPIVDGVIAVLATTAASHLAFCAHSIPLSMADSSDYVSQLLDASKTVAEAVEARTGVARKWDLVFQSRSGAPGQPWLEPDINDHLRTVAAEGATGVVMVPIGFVSDHMEVVYDLDTQATETAATLSLPVARSATPGVDPRFVDMIVSLVDEREQAAGGTTPTRLCLGGLGPRPDTCAPDCCPAPARPATGAAPGRPGSPGARPVTTGAAPATYSGPATHSDPATHSALTSGAEPGHRPDGGTPPTS